MTRKALAAGRHQASGKTVLTSPIVGIATAVVRAGTMLSEGDAVARVQVLGVPVAVVVPAGVRGYVSRTIAGDRERVAVEFGTELVALSVATDMAEATLTGTEEAAGARDVFSCPSSGRFYSRPSPDKEPFVRPGQTISRGDEVCLLEVMKTFNRITFDGRGVPERARVVRVLVEDGDDLGSGDPVLEIEPL